MSSLTIDVETASSENKHKRLARWVEECALMCKPDRVHWCDGSEGEYQPHVAADDSLRNGDSDE